MQNKLTEALASQLASTLKVLGNLLGILEHEPDVFFRWGIDVTVQLSGQTMTAMQGVLTTKIEEQVKARSDAKKSKNWVLADQIRDELKKQGVLLEDKPDGTTSWRQE